MPTTLFTNQEETSTMPHWLIQGGMANNRIGFAAAFRFGKRWDLSLVARDLDEGVTLCVPRFIAGKEHLRRILIQACECWNRNQKLARSRSIDLLMRITCQAQISRAILVSGVSDSRYVALFGLVSHPNDVEKLYSVFLTLGGTRDDSLLEMNRNKELFLKKFHELPSDCSDTQIIELLVEKSVLLSFSK